MATYCIANEHQSEAVSDGTAVERVGCQAGFWSSIPHCSLRCRTSGIADCYERGCKPSAIAGGWIGSHQSEPHRTAIDGFD
jgi:hypothetical protein